MHRQPEPTHSAAGSFDAGRRLFITVCDPATDHRLDYELLMLPFEAEALDEALTRLRERHVDRLTADDEDSTWLPCANELYAHRVPDDGNVVEFDPATVGDLAVG
jgi:hypothetical protein